MLLDLPDHDSTEVSHHLEVDRLIGMTDLMVWVLDPQKYADAAVHDRFLQAAGHAQGRDAGRAQPHRRGARRTGASTMLADVRRLLELDGLGGVPVLATSATTGEGIDELRRAIGKRVADKASTRTRLAGDISDAAARLTAHSGDAEPRELGAKDQRELVEALTDAAGVPIVVDAVRRATTIRARRATGWPLTAWVSRLQPGPAAAAAPRPAARPART